MIAGDVVKANENGLREESCDPNARYRLIRLTRHRDMWVARDMSLPTLIVGLYARCYEKVK
jgi:hypothetical protein